MANEHYENVNTHTEERERDNRKPKTHDMLEALETAMDSTRKTLTKALEEVRKLHPELDLGCVIRLFHMSCMKTINSNPPESFKIVLGLVGFAIFGSLTDEDKEALRNDTFGYN